MKRFFGAFLYVLVWNFLLSSYSQRSVVFCDLKESRNKTLAETVIENAENARNAVIDAGKNLTQDARQLSDDVVEMDVEVRDAMEEVLHDEPDIFEVTTEFMGVDVTGCDRGLLNKLDEDCGTSYDKVIEEAQKIGDDGAKTEAISGALEDMEKCSLQAYDTANCVTDKAAISENLKYAQQYLSVVANTSCSGFKLDDYGCDRCLRKKLEDDCDTEYNHANEEAQHIEDEGTKTEAICCALEKFEKCNLQAYDTANCVTGKATIRENLKAARLFLSVVANISCSRFRGQCDFYNSVTSTSYTYAMSFGAIVTLVFSEIFLIYIPLLFI